MYGIQKDGNDNPMCKTAKETLDIKDRYKKDIKNRILDIVGEAEGGMI